mmetsp:Transcript_19682/g.43793  ORF Transcript_19682/g.43793 Transcript_19682/m.43793 type:complete len:113 (-) Transcript_19682:441-779(-)
MQVEADQWGSGTARAELPDFPHRQTRNPPVSGKQPGVDAYTDRWPQAIFAARSGWLRSMRRWRVCGAAEGYFVPAGWSQPNSKSTTAEAQLNTQPAEASNCATLTPNADIMG